MAKIRISEFSAKNNFCPPACLLAGADQTKLPILALAVTVTGYVTVTLTVTVAVVAGYDLHVYEPVQSGLNWPPPPGRSLTLPLHHNSHQQHILLGIRNHLSMLASFHKTCLFSSCYSRPLSHFVQF